MREAVIVEALRTPIGRRNGTLKDIHPVDLAAQLLQELVARTKLDPARIDDVIFGCVTQVGEQSTNAARSIALAAGFPESVPGVTIDRQCGSSQQAVHFGAQAIMAGAADVVIAGGVESMSRVPMGSNFMQGPGKPFGERMRARYDNKEFNQGVGAEMIAERWNLSREALDQFSLESHRKAVSASEAGHFAKEIVPITLQNEAGETVTLSRDEGPRGDTSMEKLGTLKTPFKEGGKITAGSASQISDGAAAVLLMERSLAEKLGYKPRARFVSFAMAGDDPVIMLTAPIPATRKALERAGLTLDQIDAIEINEAFAPVVMAWQKELGADPSRVNLNGGAIALGHPLGASGARLMTTLLNVLERTGGRYGLQTMCEGGGMANATIIERL
ncbi:MAG TPA: thiolase family protein [Oscillatoriaceae cyanobacterium]